MKLTACIIVKNEENNIKECLDSIHPIVNEIIIVDTGSSDRTLDIVSDFPKTKIFHKEWTDHFSDARNFSLDQATSEWIFVIDADEIIDCDDYETLLRCLDRQDIDGYYMGTRNYTNNYIRVDFVSSNSHLAKNYAGWTPSHKTRIFRNKKQYRFTGRMHEIVDRSILENGGNIAEFSVPIHHYGNDILSIDKINLYKRLALKKIEEEPSNPMAYYEIGQIQLTCGENDDAINSFKKGLELKPDFGDNRYANLNYEIGNIYYQIKNDLEKALEYYLKAIEVRPGHMYVYSMVGSIYRKKKFFDLAETYLQEAILLGSAIPNTYYDLGWIKINNKFYKEAISCFHKVIDMAPKYVGAYNNLAVAYHLAGNKEEATKYWNEGLAIDPTHEEILGNVKFFGAKIWHAADDQKTKHQ